MTFWAIRLRVHTFKDACGARRQIARLAGQPLLARSFDRMDIDKDAAGDGGLVRHIADKPPGVMHVSDEEKERLIDGLEAYLQTLPSHWRRVLSSYVVVDVDP
jgi:hypothetical protein